MNLGLTSGLGGREGPKVEELKIKGIGDWVICGSQWREGKSLTTPRLPIKRRCRQWQRVRDHLLLWSPVQTPGFLNCGLIRI